MVTEVSVFRPGSDAPDSAEGPVLSDERLSPEEAAKVGAYLEAGAVVMHTTVRGIDLLDGNAPVIPLTIRTDGEYVWTGPVTYYVQTYGVAPDEAFLAALRARDYAPRVPTDDEVAAAAAFILAED